MNAFVSVTESLAKIHAKEISYPELLSLYQTQIERTNESIQGFLDIFDTPVSATETPLLPIAIKDNICLKDHPTTCASRILEHFIPPYQATVVQKLLDANLSILGKTNMDEFAMGSSNENSAFKITSNPWNTNHVPGGSSGGSAAVVAAGQAPWSLGSDTGGSIRQPASFCGIVGLKPTYGLVSRYGLVAYASSLDQIGPMTRTVEDNALLLTLIAGHDPKDSTSLNQDSPDFKAQLGQPIQGMKIGLPRQMFAQGISDEVKSALDAAIKVYESLGAHIEEVDLPHLNHALATYYLIATSEASSNLARYDGVSYGHRSQHASHLQEMITMSRTEGFGKEVKLRILLGTFALSEGYYDAYYKKAQQVRHLIIKGFKSAFEQFDALLSPTVPMTAFQKGEKTQDPLSMYLTDVLTVPANLAGLPALSVPCGFDSQGLPIGLQLMGKPLSEATLYQIAHAYEQATDWHKQHPEL